MRQRQLHLGFRLVVAGCGPLQQQPGQALRGGMRKPQAADLLIGALTIFAQVLRGLQAVRKGPDIETGFSP